MRRSAIGSITVLSVSIPFRLRRREQAKKTAMGAIVVPPIALSGILAGVLAVAGYPPDDSLMTGRTPRVPAEFREGCASLTEVEDWSRSLIQSDPVLTYRDLDCDGRDDVLVEIAFARGTTGDRSFLAFSRTDRGYRYLGETWRILRTFSYPEGCYLVQHGSAGGGETVVSLQRVTSDGFSEVGRIVLRAGDGGEEHDRLVFERLAHGDPTRDELLEIFGS